MSVHNDTNVVPFKPKAQPHPQLIKPENTEPAFYCDASLPVHIESLHAFIAVAANELKVENSVVETVIRTLFKIEDVNMLLPQDFKSAVTFLVGLHGNASKKQFSVKIRHDYERRSKNYGCFHTKMMLQIMQSWMHYAMTSISAMIHWAAHENEVSPELVQAMLEMEFGVDGIYNLAQKHHDEVLIFLTDLNVKEFLH